jgi:hypothetical protein
VFDQLRIFWATSQSFLVLKMFHEILKMLKQRSAKNVMKFFMKMFLYT